MNEVESAIPIKLWARHWITFRSRKFGSLREETPFMLLYVEKGSIGERDIPVAAKPLFRHWMSNVFIYLMPEGADQGESVHGWELKIGLTLEAAQEFVEKLTKTIEDCVRRRDERHKELANVEM